ncbi:hypothetical protein BJ165DRAFT_1532838 [Panaeolus papilionaceus]|nr:hypothetical protein BJ165DRAFT_1532838 [Panaeolus papilionaceus]
MESQPGHGVFFVEIDQFKRKNPTTSLRNRNLVCRTCTKGRKQAGGSMYWCMGCDAVPYCSRECQKFDWPLHQKQCQMLRHTTIIYDIVERALNHPKILHYLRVAIIIETKLLQVPKIRLPSARYTANLKISLDPPEPIRRQMQHNLINQFNDTVLSGRELVLPQGDDVADLADVEGWLFIHPLITCVKGEGGMTPHDAIDLWNEAKKTQRHGWTPEKGVKPSTSASSSTPTRTYTVQPGVERFKNPVILTAWNWGGTVVTNALEITPDAFRDARRGAISDDMRIVFPWEDPENLVPHKTNRTTEQLIMHVNQFMRIDESLNLKSKMGTHDKRVQLERLFAQIIADV